MAASVQFTITGTGSAKVVKDFDSIRKSLEASLVAIQKFNAANKAKQTFAEKEAAAIERLKSAYQRAEATGKANADGQKKRLDEILRRQEALTASINKVSALSPLAKYRNELELLRRKYQELALAGKGDSVGGKNLLDQIKQRSNQIREINTVLDKAEGAANKPTKKSGFLDLFVNVGRFQLASAAVSTLADTFIYAATTAIEFEAAIVNLGALMDGVQKKSLPDLTAQALFLGQTTAFTATEVAKLQTELLKLGFSPDSILLSTRAIVDFSTAVQASSDRVAALTGATLKAFNLTAIETTRVVDTLTRGIVQSALDFTYLETALPTVAAAAATANISLEETISVLGILADRGVQASTAATAFRNILIESASRGLDYHAALDLINKSQNKLVTAYDLFGKRGAVQALILAKNHEELTRNIEANVAATQSFGDALITARKIAEEQLTSTQGRITLLKSAWDGLLISIGKTGPIKSFVTELANSLNGITAVVNGTADIGTAWDKVVEKQGGFETGVRAAISLGVDPLLSVISEVGVQSENRARVEQTIADVLQKQASTKTGVFLDEEKLIDKRDYYEKVSASRAKIEKEVTESLYKTGLSINESKAKANELINKNIILLEKLATEQAALASEEEVSVLNYTASDIRAVATLRQIQEIKSAFEDARERTNAFGADARKLGVTLGIVAKQEEKIKKALGLDKEVGSIKTATDRMRDLGEAFQKASTDAERFRILEDINTLQQDLDAQEAAYRKFVENLRGLALRLSSDKVKQDYVNFSKEQLALDESLAIERLNATVRNETVRSAKEAEIRNSFKTKEIQTQIDVADQTSVIYEKLLSELRLSYAEGLQLKIKVNTETVKQDINLAETQELFRINQYITNEKDRQSFSDFASLTAKRASLEADLQALQALKTYNQIQSLLLGTTVNNSSELISNIKKIQTEIVKTDRELNQLAPTLGVGELEVNESIDRFNKIKAAYEQFAIDIKQNPIDFIKINGDTAQEVLKETLNGIEILQESAETTRLIKQKEAEIEAKKLRGESAQEEIAQKTELVAKLAEITARSFEKEAAKQQKQDEERLRLARRTAEAYANIAAKAGEQFGDALINGDIKKAFKELLKDLIDIFIKSQIIELTASLTKAIATFNAPQIISITAGIAALSAIGAAGKAAIDRFEYGGRIQDGSSGGVLSGPRHKQGGIKAAVRKTKQIVELEGGETVINRRSSSLFRRELSAINAYRNYGRRFEDGGLISNPPQVLPKTQTTFSLSEDSIIQQAVIIANKVGESQIAVMLQQNAQLIDALKIALDSNNRLAERLKTAQKNSKI